MTWIDVDAQKLRTAAESLRQTDGEIQALADYAKEADPDWWMWGVAGLVMAPIYFQFADFFHDSIAEAKDAVGGLAGRIVECADDHENNDDGIAADLAKIGREIGDGEI